MATPSNPPVASSDLPPVQPQARPPAEDPEVVRLRGEVANSRREIDALKQRFTAPLQQAAQPGNQMTSAEANRQFYQDPIAHSAAIAQRVIDDRLRQEGEPTRQTLIQIARENVRSKDPKLFDKYYLEVEAAVNTVAPQFQGNIQVWENALKLVKGNHIDEIIAERAAQAPPQPEASRGPAIHIREGGGPDSPSARPAQSAAGTELSPDEKYTAKKLHLTEEQYKAGKAHLEGQNDPVRSPVGPSSWDKQITFDSRERRRRLRAEADKARRAS